MNLIIFGPPGAGKGTQADYLAKDFNLFKVSTGDLLREEIEKKSSLGLKIQEIIKEGLLVSDNIINNLIENLLIKKNFSNRLIFDGYPRTINQVKSLDVSLNKHNQNIFCVLSLSVDKETVIKRIVGRQICSKCKLTFNEFFNPSNNSNHKCGEKFLEKRSDDNSKVIELRYNTYLKETKPIIDYYKDKGLLHEIDGRTKITSIYNEICSIISRLKGVDFG